MPNPSAAFLVIGDEILSGRTKDANVQHIAIELGKIGIDLGEVCIVPDQHDVIVSRTRQLSETHDYVFTSGGIGPTHDDITADAIAAAFSVPIDVRDDARSLLAEHYGPLGIELNAARLQMARVPEGASLILNPISAAPGFTLNNVHVMAGVPAIFQAMLANVLTSLTGGTPLTATSTVVWRPEGELAKPLATLADKFPNLSMGSYPFFKEGRFGTNLVVRGSDKDEVAAASAELRQVFSENIQQ